MEQNDSGMKYNDYRSDQDEIDIGQLFQKIWSRKSFIVIFVFVVGLAVMASMLSMFLVKPPISEFSRVLQLNFSGAAEQLYPSGQRFAANDIIASKVLSEVYRINGLAEQNINERAFLEAFSVSPYASNVEFIKEKFQALLNSKKLSRPEIVSLEEEYLQQLKTARSKFVRIAYIDSRLFSIDALTINKVLADIPKVWSKYAIEELGVLNLKVSGGGQYEPNTSGRFEYVKMLSYLKKVSKDLDNSLDVLLEDEIGGSIRQPGTGKSAVDVKERLSNLMEFDVQPLFAAVTNLGIVKSKFRAKLYLQNTIQELTDNKLLMEEKLKNLQFVLSTYLKGESSNQSSGRARSGGENMGFTQVNGDFFDRITSLVEDKSDAKYRQKLLDQQLKAMQEIESINTQLVKLNRALLQLDSQEQTITKQIKSEYIEHIDFVNAQLGEIIKEYKALLNLRNKQVLGSSSSLYRLVDSNMSVSTGLRTVLKKIILVSGIAAILALLLAMLIVLIRRAPEDNNQTAN